MGCHYYPYNLENTNPRPRRKHHLHGQNPRPFIVITGVLRINRATWAQQHASTETCTCIAEHSDDSRQRLQTNTNKQTNKHSLRKSGLSHAWPRCSSCRQTNTTYVRGASHDGTVACAVVPCCATELWREAAGSKA